jgi:hypothetical protein
MLTTLKLPSKSSELKSPKGESSNKESQPLELVAGKKTSARTEGEPLREIEMTESSRALVSNKNPKKAAAKSKSKAKAKAKSKSGPTLKEDLKEIFTSVFEFYKTPNVNLTIPDSFV